MTGPEVSESKATSSNRFATGSNQNCGNVLSERSSTGLHAPPGGKSSICLGGNVQEPSKPRGSSNGYAEVSNSDMSQGPSSPETTKPRGGVSSNAFSQGSNQNCGNFITDRPTTHVHAAPGGNSSICLGTDTNVGSQKSRAAAEAPAPVPTPARARGRAPPGGQSSMVLG